MTVIPQKSHPCHQGQNRPECDEGVYAQGVGGEKEVIITGNRV